MLLKYPFGILPALISLNTHNKLGNTFYKQLFWSGVPYIFSKNQLLSCRGMGSYVFFPKISYYLAREGGPIYFFQKSVTILQGKGVIYFSKNQLLSCRGWVGPSRNSQNCTYSTSGVEHTTCPPPLTILTD